MKKLILLFFLSPLTCFSQGPFWYWDYQISPISENQLAWDSSNLDNYYWHYGFNHKPFFGDFAQKILVTDTTAMYLANTNASVDLILTRPNSGGAEDIGTAYVLKFDHKIDTDPNLAGGFFEFNIDNDSLSYVKNGDTLKTFWLKFLLNPGQTENYVDITPGYFYPVITESGDTIMLTGNYNWHHFHHNINGYHDTITNGPTAFTGTFSDWESFYAELFFYYGGIKAPDPEDSLIFRFHFKSDAGSSGKNGWAIKNIETGYAVHPTGGTTESQTNNTAIFPNPANNNIRFVNQAVNTELITVKIFDTNGRCIDILTYTGELLLNISEYPAGIYYYQLSSDSEKNIQSGKIIKL